MAATPTRSNPTANSESPHVLTSTQRVIVMRILSLYRLVYNIGSMSKINQIEQRILELSGGAFQKLCDSILAKEGFTDINSIGSVSGSNKVRRGTPDCWIALPNGKYIFAEDTTQQDGLLGKIKSDIAKCLNTREIGIRVEQIDKIIYFHTSTLGLAEHEDLIQLCQNHGADFEISGLNKISFKLKDNYPDLAYDHLGIEIDTHQILDLPAFIEAYDRNKLTTTLNTDLQAREAELENALAILEHTDVLILGGRPGVGKSRLALEVCRKYKEKYPACETKGIFYRGQDLTNDLYVYFGNPNHYLLFVDDANRVSSFNDILEFRDINRQKSKIKIVATVRDYALQKLQTDIPLHTRSKVIEITRLSNDEIGKLVDKEFGIVNYRFVDRINDIACGNPRLAIMMAEIIETKKTLASINDVSQVYESYYRGVQTQLLGLDDPQLLKVVGIVTFFRVIDKTYDEFMVNLSNVFGISTNEFWGIVNQLHQLEIVDLYENDVVRTSDQVLATYFFYRVFFKDQILDFALLLQHFFPQFQQKFVNILNSVLGAFNEKEIGEQIRPIVKQTLKNLRNAQHHDIALKLCQVFWFIIPTDTLLYLQELIEQYPQQNIDLANLNFKPKNVPNNKPILNVIKSFRYAKPELMIAAVELLLEFVKRDPSNLPFALELLTKQFGFKLNSYHLRYIKQQSIIDLLAELAEGGENYLCSKIFVIVSQVYLKTRHFDVKSSQGRSVIWQNFKLRFSDELLHLRKTIWSNLFSLWHVDYLQSDVLSALKDYHFRGVSDELLQADADELLPFFESTLTPSKLQHCIFVHDVLDIFDSSEICYSLQLRTRYSTTAYETYSLLHADRAERHRLDLDYTAFQKYRRDMLRQHFETFSLVDFKMFLRHCKLITLEVSHFSHFYEITSGLTKILRIAAEEKESVFCEIIDFYLSLGDPLNIPPLFFISKVIEIQGSSHAEELVNQYHFAHVKQWQFAFYNALPTSEKTSERAEELKTLFQYAKPQDLSTSLAFLLDFLPAAPRILEEVSAIILKKCETHPYAIDLFSDFFDSHLSVLRHIPEAFQHNISLLKQILLKWLIQNPSRDYRCEALLLVASMDHNFLGEFTNHIIQQNSQSTIQRFSFGERDFSHLWLHDEYELLIDQMLQAFYTHLKTEKFSHVDLGILFNLDRHREVIKVVRDRQIDFLAKHIKEDCGNALLMRHLFNVAVNFEFEQFRHLLSLFLKSNDQFATFKEIPLEPNFGMMDMDKAISIYRSKIANYQSLLPLVDGVKFLRHRQRIENLIDRYWDWIKHEEKRRFIEPY